MANIAPNTPAFDAQRYRDAVYQMACQLGPTLAIHLSFNRPTTLDVAAQNLRAFQARMERERLKRNWQKRVAERGHYLAVVEHPEDNLHIHAVFAIPPAHQQLFLATMQLRWSQIVASGGTRGEPIYDLEGAVRYMTKALGPNRSDLLLFSEGLASPLP